MKIALLQLNYIVGDIEGNAEKILNAIEALKDAEVDLCVTSELALMGYPPRDLLLNKSFIARAEQKTVSIAKILQQGPALLLGRAVRNSNTSGKLFYNAATFIANGVIQADFYKTLIPNYDVFDEARYFEPNQELNILHFKGKKIGITICEDIWNFYPDNDFIRYHENPVEKLAAHNIDFLINLSASPFTVQKQSLLREPLIRQIAKKYQFPVLYVNQVGANDDLLFDGRSLAVDAKGDVIGRAEFFREDTITVDITQSSSEIAINDFSKEEEIFRALVLGTQDYAKKTGFQKAILGLSGGIDSALTLVVAVHALGHENVHAIIMPSPYSSESSVQDALKIAENLAVKTTLLPITSIMQAYDATLRDVFLDLPKDITEENLQARIRGNLLMALSNKFNALLLTTGNKSEVSVGYCTIYGDMCGGLAVISDVYKTDVYRVSKWINHHFEKEIIPQNIITKAPSAELRENQKDQDSLPEYEVLDEVLYRYLELHYSPDEIIAAGTSSEVVYFIMNLLSKSEFKRKQAAPGLRMTQRAFGTGWKMPIVAKTINKDAKLGVNTL